MTKFHQSVLNSIQRPEFIVWLMVFTALFIASCAATEGWVYAFSAEGSGAEVASVVIWVIGAVAAKSLVALYGWRYWPVPSIFLLLALREVSFFGWNMGGDILLRSTLASDAALWVKALSVFTVVWGVSAIIGFLFCAWPWAKALWRREAWAVTYLIGGLSAVAAQIFEKLGKTLTNAGITVTDTMKTTFVIAEEALELAFPFLMLYAVILFARAYTARRATIYSIYTKTPPRPSGVLDVISVPF